MNIAALKRTMLNMHLMRAWVSLSVAAALVDDDENDAPAIRSLRDDAEEIVSRRPAGPLSQLSNDGHGQYHY